jgi:hypothetical protein
MKRAILLSFACVVFLFPGPISAFRPTLTAGGATAAPGGGGTSYLCVNDDMSGTFSTNWTNLGTGNRLVGFSGTPNFNMTTNYGGVPTPVNVGALYNVSLGSQDQAITWYYTRTQLDQQIGVAMRATDGTWSTGDTSYTFTLYDSELTSPFCSNTFDDVENGTCGQITFSPADAHWYSLKISGTGSTTSVKIWDRGTSLPTSNCDFGAGDGNCGWSSPTVSTDLSTLGITNYRTGNYVGVWGWKNNTTDITWDDVRINSAACNN